MGLHMRIECKHNGKKKVFLFFSSFILLNFLDHVAL